MLVSSVVCDSLVRGDLRYRPCIASDKRGYSPRTLLSTGSLESGNRVNIAALIDFKWEIMVASSLRRRSPFLRLRRRYESFGAGSCGSALHFARELPNGLSGIP